MDFVLLLGLWDYVALVNGVTVSRVISVREKDRDGDRWRLRVRGRDSWREFYLLSEVVIYEVKFIEEVMKKFLFDF